MTEIQYLEASDGHRLHLHVHRPKANRPPLRAVVLLHGIFTNSSENGRLDEMADALADKGIVALRFDFRGHGKSSWPSTSFSPLAAIRDLHAAVLWCSLNSLSVSLLGSSYGGSIALTYLSLYKTFRADRLVLWNPVIDYNATFTDPSLPWGEALFTAERVEQLRATNVTRLMPHFRAGGSLYDEMLVLEPYRQLETIIAPTLILHGDADDKVPIDATRHHAGTFSDAVKYSEVPGAGHGFGEDIHGQEVLTQSLAWFTKS